MQLPKELTTVTPLSKLIALIVFITLPVIAFFYGMNYQSKITEQNNQTQIISPTNRPVLCTLEAKICPDGTSVGRSGPNCEFDPCPSSDTSSQDGKFCGGIAGINCPVGFTCKLDGNYPDAGGNCIKNNNSAVNFKCPEDQWIDCIPGPDKSNTIECSDKFIDWATENCPNFQGAAY